MRAYWLPLLLLPLAGCVDDSTPASVADAVCSGPMFEASGKVIDRCNTAVATGPRPALEPSIVVNPNDPLHIVAGAADYNLGAPWTGVYVSRDGGKTWSQDGIPGYPGGPISPLTGYTGAGDSALAFAPDGTLYYAGITLLRDGATADGLVAGASASYGKGPDLFVARSEDGGETWDINFPQRAFGGAGGVSVSTPAGAIGVPVLAAEAYHDKEFIAVGPDGTIALTWTRFQFVGVLGSCPIAITLSSDKGETWTEPTVISRAACNQGSVPAWTPDGKLVVTWAEFAEDDMVTTVTRMSPDGGVTWEDIKEVATMKNVEPTHNHRVNGFPSVAAGPDGTLRIVWSANHTGDIDIFVAESIDAGATWTDPVLVNPVSGDGRDQYFPWITTGPDGQSHIVYFDGADDPRNQFITTHLASSLDGVTWIDRVITDAPFDPNRDGFTGSNFIGDYLAVAVGSDGRVHAVWPDTRSAVDERGDQDIYHFVLEP